MTWAGRSAGSCILWSGPGLRLAASARPACALVVVDRQQPRDVGSAAEPTHLSRGVVGPDRPRVMVIVSPGLAMVPFADPRRRSGCDEGQGFGHDLMSQLVLGAHAGTMTVRAPDHGHIGDIAVADVGADRDRAERRCRAHSARPSDQVPLGVEQVCVWLRRPCRGRTTRRPCRRRVP